MTTEFVLRLDKKRAEHFKKEARKRRKTPNALMRQALDGLIGEPQRDSEMGISAKRRSREKAGKKTKGVGWAKHFEKLFREGRRINGNPEDEIRSRDRDRGYR